MRHSPATLEVFARYCSTYDEWNALTDKDLDSEQAAALWDKLGTLEDQAIAQVHADRELRELNGGD